jgi:adenylyl- and sulfurtransferase ThiI
VPTRFSGVQDEYFVLTRRKPGLNGLPLSEGEDIINLGCCFRF